MALTPDALTRAVKDMAREVGFVSAGICRPDAIPLAPDRLSAFVDAGWHGQMTWMEERMHWRADPSALWPDAQSVIMLAESYAPDHNPLDLLQAQDRGAISVYAQGRDYHDVVKKRLKRLGRWVLEQVPDEQIKVFVDTAPVMEKPLAQAAGLGWQGKHTNLLSRDFGNWVFLGAIFTTAQLVPDAPATDHCGACRACLDICPTQAFEGPHRLNATRCISYLTIEHDGPVPEELRPKLGNRIYGCDDCLAVCPWNKFAVAAQDLRLTARDALRAPKLAELAQLTDAEFRALFTASPVKRIGLLRFLRNVCYAMGNSKDRALLPQLRDLSHHHDQTVAEAARWAIGRLERLP